VTQVTGDMVKEPKLWEPKALAMGPKLLALATSLDLWEPNALAIITWKSNFLATHTSLLNHQSAKRFNQYKNTKNNINRTDYTESYASFLLFLLFWAFDHHYEPCHRHRDISF